MKPINRTERFEVNVHVDGEFAADVHGLQIASLSDSDFDVLYNIWLEYSVIRLRGQTLNDNELVTFSRRFGELDLAPKTEGHRDTAPDRPEVLVVSNIVENGRQMGVLGSGEAVWHTDMSYVQMPPKASLLYALETPQAGGETSFLDMHHAYRQLNPLLRERTANLQIKHDGTTSSAGRLRPGMSEIADLNDPLQTPGFVHPAVIQHPETTRTCLYLGRRHRAWIPEREPEEADQQLDELWAHTLNTARTWTQTWTPGDLVIWDNRAVMHQRNPFDAKARRLMHRTQVRGETAPIAPSSKTQHQSRPIKMEQHD